jgi:hypothetical protein
MDKTEYEYEYEYEHEHGYSASSMSKVQYNLPAMMAGQGNSGFPSSSPLVLGTYIHTATQFWTSDDPPHSYRELRNSGVIHHGHR